MQRIYINYANDDFVVQQNINSTMAMDVGSVDTVISYSPSDIDKDFYEANKQILNKIRGGGYWLWKFYFIHKTLTDDAVKNGDVVFYADSGTDVLKDLSPVYDLPNKYNQDVILFVDGAKCKNFIKRDAFILVDCDTQDAYNFNMCAGGFNVWRKSEFSINFIEECLKYACDSRIITDSRSEMGDELGDFMMHRHDQSVFSLVAYKNKLKVIDMNVDGIYGYEQDGVKPNTFLMSKRKSNRNKFRRLQYKIAMLPEKLWRYGGFWGYLFRQFKKK